MKNKRNSVSSLFLACALFANYGFATTTVDTSSVPLTTFDDSSIIGTLYTETVSGDATAFSYEDLYYNITTKSTLTIVDTNVIESTTTGSVSVYTTYSDGSTDWRWYSSMSEYEASSDVVSSSTVVDTGYYEVPLYNTYTETREIEYTFEVDENSTTTTYITGPDGNTYEFWGWKSELSETVDTDGDIVSYTNSNGYTISIAEYNTYYFDQEETYFVIEGTNIDLDATAIAKDGNATALDLTGLVSYYDSESGENSSTETTITTNGISNGMSVSSDNYSLGFTEIITGGIDINATASSTGGNATAIKGYIEHTTFDVNLSDTGWVSLDNGDLTLNLNATATSTYDEDTSTWSDATAIGIQYVEETVVTEIDSVDIDYSNAYQTDGVTNATSTTNVYSGDIVTTTITVDGDSVTKTVRIATYADGSLENAFSTTTTTENSNNGIDKVLYADNGTTAIDITAVATGAGDDADTTDDDYKGAFGVIGDVYIETGNVNISAYAYAIDDFKYGADAVDGSGSGSAMAIDGEAEFVGTKVNLTAYSETGYATAVGDALTLTEGASLTATVVGYEAVGIEDAYVENSTLTVNVAAVGEADETAGTNPSAVGAEDVTIVDSTLTIKVTAAEDAEGATVTGATTIELLGSSTLNLTAVSVDGVVTGVENLNIGYKSDSDIVSATIYAQGTSATGVENLGSLEYKNSIHSLNTVLDVTAVATGTLTEVATDYNAEAIGIDSDIIFSDDENYEVETLAANVSAIASYANEEVKDEDVDPALDTVIYSSNVSATAVDGSIGIYVDDGNGNTVVGGVQIPDVDDEDAYVYTLSITGSYAASASASSLNDTATAEAIAINGDVFANIAGDITATAIATSAKDDAAATMATASATAIEGDVSGDISGSVGAYAKATYTGVFTEDEVDDTAIYTSASATAISGDVTGDISGSVYAIAVGSDATAIGGEFIGDISGSVYAGATSTENGDDAIATAITSISSDDSDAENIIYSSISGSVEATATATSDGAVATAIAIGGIDSDMTISGNITATATANAEASETADSATATATASATALDGIGDGITLTFDSATITATATSTATATATASVDGAESTVTVYADSETPDASETTSAENADGDKSTVTATASVSSSAIAINAGTNSFSVVGDVTVSGDIIADTITLGKTEMEDEVEVEYGASITQVSGTLNAGIDVSNSASAYSLGFNVSGELPTIAGSVNYSYATDSDTQSAVLSSILVGTAAALVGDNDTISNLSLGGEDLSTVVDALLEDGEDSLSVEGNNSLDYTLSSNEDGSVTATVEKTTYFQDKAGTSNAGSIASYLDSLELVVTEDTDADALVNLETRTFKEKLDTMELDSFVPHANSFIAQVNAETFSNLSVANVWRMRSLMSESSKTAREKAVDAIRANPAFDGEDPDPTAKPKRVAQFQSVNMIGSRDGGSNAPDYDFISTGGTADMDFFFGNNVVVGVGVGSIYNKVDADISSVGTAESTSFIVNSYAMWSKDNFEAFGTLGYAHSFNESKKSTAEGTEKADWDSDSIYNLAGVTYSVDFENGLILRPMAMYSLVFQQYNESKTKGSSSYGTTVDAKSYINFKTMIGAELVYSITEEFEMIARLFWTHEFGDNSYDSTYTNDFLSPYMGSLSYNGEEADRDSLLAGLGLAYRFENGISAYLDYNANMSGDYLGHNLNAALQVKF